MEGPTACVKLPVQDLPLICRALGGTPKAVKASALYADSRRMLQLYPMGMGFPQNRPLADDSYRVLSGGPVSGPPSDKLLRRLQCEGL